MHEDAGDPRHARTRDLGRSTIRLVLVHQALSMASEICRSSAVKVVDARFDVRALAVVSRRAAGLSLPATRPHR